MAPIIPPNVEATATRRWMWPVNPDYASPGDIRMENNLAMLSEQIRELTRVVAQDLVSEARSRSTSPASSTQSSNIAPEDLLAPTKN
ncbi:hypothetical protein LTR16_006544, partial [Cryomyces antarcticus]